MRLSPAPAGARLRKVVSDLSGNKPRTALVTLSIAVGIAALGMVVGSRALMLQSLDASTEQGAFASASFRTDPFGEQLLRRVRAIPGVEGAEGRRVVAARLETGPGRWDQLTLYAVRNYVGLEIGKISAERGVWPPPMRRLVLERASLAYLKTRIGAAVGLAMPDGTRRRLRIAGTAHDLSALSTRTSGMSYGYVTFATLAWLGDRAGLNQLDIATSRELSRREVEGVAAQVRSAVERSGRTVFATTVREPGEFWAHDAVQSMVLLLTVLAVVCLLMSGFLVVNIVSALLAQQVRQIGVMKAVGASARDTGVMYLSTSVIFGALAVCVAVPIGAIGALLIVRSSTRLINLDAPDFTLSPDVIALEIGAGLLVPAAAALGPVVAASRRTVRESIARHGIGHALTGEGLVDRLVDRLQGVSAAVRLALRNTFRGKRRLVLTLTALVLGGAVFLAMLSVRASLESTLDDAARYRAQDIELALDRPARAAELRREAVRVPGVLRVEAWGTAGAYRRRSDGSESETLTVLGLPERTSLIRPIVRSGRWLRPGDRGAVVVNTAVLRRESDLRVGDRARLRVNGNVADWRVVGVVRGILEGPLLYADERSLAAVSGEAGLARRLQVVTSRHDRASQRRVAQVLEERLKAAGFLVGAVRTSADRRAIDAANFRVISTFLTVMAVLIAAVAGLGLMGTLTINVLERSREIGVMRAIGAGGRDVVKLVAVEGFVIALLGWLAAVPLALPLGRLLSREVGELFIGTPLTYSFPLTAPFLWLGTVVVLAGVASVLPARRAARLTVRDALVYE